MPAYDFENLETGCIEERIMSYTKLEQFKKDNPHLRQVILSAPTTVGGVGDRVKTDDGFKEVLSKIGDAHPGSEVHARHGSKDIKREKSVATIKKHAAIQARKK
tara:strand:+ start:832 stop:1143 length:312 start_codon:yes stop_codon:yes gene_type:complete